MRPISTKMDSGWRREDKTGEYRPTARATIQRLQLQLFPYDTSKAQGGDWDHQRKRKGNYTSVIFGDESRPVELHGIKTLSWNRSLDQDVATCTLTIDNTKVHPLGTAVQTSTYFDDPGFMTYNRGIYYTSEGWKADPGANRWNHESNVWRNLIVPDRLVKTYEGYGSDYSVYPDDDPNLMISGVWLIDRVDYSHNGQITIEMRDVGRMLLTHICFPPAVPNAEYPLSWSKIQSVQVDERDAKGGEWKELKGIASASSSNTAYVGQGLVDPPYPYYVSQNGHVNGHHANHALEPATDKEKYWMSTGQTTRNSFVWWQADFDSPKDLAGIRIDPTGGPYRIYISIKTEADGWIGNKKIPYEVTTAGINNGSKIPFVQSVWADRWNKFDVIFRRKYRNVKAIRLTFTKLNDNKAGDYPFRAMLRDVKAYIGVFDDLHYGEGKVTKVVGNYRDYCADEQTEILTRRGWLNFEEVKAGDETLAIDPATGLSSWQPIQDVYRKHRQREMLSMESTAHSSLTTPDHRWLITDHAGRRDWRTTETLKHGHSIPLAAQRADLPQEQKYTDAFVELVAWFWTEGWTHAQGGCVNAYLAQSRRVNPTYCERIEAALRVLAGEPGQRRGREGSWSMRERPDGVVTYALGQDLTRGLLAVASGKVPSPDFLTALTGAQLGLYVETSIDADGWRDGLGGRRLSQASEERVKAFQFACSLAGIPTSVQNRGDMWVINLLKIRSFRPALTKREVVDYDGVVWCPVLERDFNWLARRNGKVYFTGNTQVVKYMCAWGGFWWPPQGLGRHFWTTNATDKQFVPYATYDPMFTNGRVWGTFQATGTVGEADLTVDLFDKKPFMDVINYVRDIVGFVFMIDEWGGVVWRMPNLYKKGNYLAPEPTDLTTRARRTRTLDYITLDEKETLLDYSTTLSSENLRERIFVANSTGKIGVAIRGFNPTYEGFRRTAGWTDQNFKTKRETVVMADMIAAQQMFDYRRTTATTPGNPAIQLDDQIRIFEKTTNETYFHYVLGIQSTLDMDAGTWEYELNTHWLGDDRADAWVIDINKLETVTQNYLNILTGVNQDMRD